MDPAQTTRILLILLLIAGLDVLIYLVAMRFNAYYRRKIKVHGIPFSRILKRDAAPARQGRITGNAAACLPEDPQQLPLYGTGGAHAPEAAIAAPAPQFRIDDEVEFSRGEMSGRIMSRSETGASGYRYLVDWGKDGIWWAPEGQIRRPDRKRIEVDA